MAKNTANKEKVYGLIVKAIAVIIAAAIVAYISTSAALSTWNPMKWKAAHQTLTASTNGDDEGNGGDEEQLGTVGEVVAIDENGNKLRSGRTYTMPQGVTFLNASSANVQTPAGDSVTVRATIKPLNADDQRVTWESDNPETVTVTPTKEGSLTATITKKSNLDNTVTITCRSVDNPEVFATCKVDQLVNGRDVELIGYVDGNPEKLVFGNTYNVNGYWDFKPGCGTIAGETANVVWNLSLDIGFIREIDKQLKALGTSYVFEGDDWTFGENTGAEVFPETPKAMFCGSNDVTADTFNRAFKLAVKSYTGAHAQIAVEADYSYKGKVYRDGIAIIDCKFDVSNIWVGVDDVELGDGFIFGT
ncbi:MAG: Ig-like domain-containing protein [Clostridia bacterium]|nr:Ig-like domain-containing protein [Clostridia bacterium]